MVYEYMKFPDGAEIVHTQVLNPSSDPTVEVNFERPKEMGWKKDKDEVRSDNRSRSAWTEAR